MKKPLIVNFFGGPGTGKSTAAAFTFSELKLRGINCELVTEFAKDKTWEKNQKALSCQPYVFGKQVYRIDRCVEDVDIIITDSPILLSSIYNQDTSIEPMFTETVIAKFNEYNNLNVFLRRTKPYNPKGRNQTESEAKDLDVEILYYLNDLEIPYSVATGDREGYVSVVDLILEYLESEEQNV